MPLNVKGLADYHVSMSNELVRSAHSLKLVEKRLVASAIAKIDSRKGNSMHAHLSKFQNIQITAIEFAEAFGINEKNAYAELKSAADDLFNRYFTITDYTKKGKERYTKIRWVGSVRYVEGEGYVSLSFTPEVYPHLHMLRREYTTYRLKNAAALRSVYSWRLFEICKSWLSFCKTKNKPVKLTLEQLRDSLGTPESYLWGDIKRRAIDTAIKEIAEQDGSIIITYKPYKKGRSVAGIYLFVEESSQLSLL